MEALYDLLCKTGVFTWKEDSKQKAKNLVNDVAGKLEA